jgi:hypothetical protein
LHLFILNFIHRRNIEACQPMVPLDSFMCGCKRDIMSHTCPLVTPYWLFVLRYSLNILNNFLKENLKTSWNFASHDYVMVYIKNLLKIRHCQKNSSPFTSVLLFKNTSYNVFKMFLGIFHSLDRCQTFRVYIPIHWK